MTIGHAQERLEADKPHLRSVEERLEMQVEGAVGEGVADLLLEVAPALQLDLDRALEEEEAIALAQPRPVEGEAGALEEAQGRVAVARRQRDADLGGERDLLARDLERLARGLEEIARKVLDLADGDCSQGDGELVAAETGDQGIRSADGLECLRRVHDCGVAAFVAVKVVDLAQAVDVDAEHGDLHRARRARRRVRRARR